MVKDKLPPRSHFAGPLEFVYYADLQGATNDFVIVMPFMSNEFNAIMDQIVVSPSRITRKGKSIADTALSHRIIMAQNAAKYIPKIEEPPPVLELKN